MILFYRSLFVVQDPNVPPFPFNDNDEMNPITPGINAGGGVTPWHDADYDNPVSVGPPVSYL